MVTKKKRVKYDNYPFYIVAFLSFKFIDTVSNTLWSD